MFLIKREQNFVGQVKFVGQYEGELFWVREKRRGCVELQHGLLQASIDILQPERFIFGLSQKKVWMGLRELQLVL